MNAARLAVYIAKNTTANIAQTFVINRAVNPRGESTWTAAWKRTAQTSQYVRNNEKRCGTFDCNDNFISKPLGDNHSNRNIINVAAWIATMPTCIRLFLLWIQNRKSVILFAKKDNYYVEHTQGFELVKSKLEAFESVFVFHFH